MEMDSRHSLAASLIAIAVIITPLAYPATLQVTVQNVFFGPRDITIEVGDTVQWVWQPNGGSHTVTSGARSAAADAGDLFDHSSNSDNPLFSFAFTQAGEQPYFCRIHEFMDMKGNVTVCCRDGDINGDCSITPNDALLAFQGFLGDIALSDCEKIHADVESPQAAPSVTPADALCIFQFFLGTPTCIGAFPQDCSCRNGNV